MSRGPIPAMSVPTRGLHLDITRGHRCPRAACLNGFRCPRVVCQSLVMVSPKERLSDPLGLSLQSAHGLCLRHGTGGLATWLTRARIHVLAKLAERKNGSL
eukprot:4634452-Lingulodinium_polyedra.AAC.1